MSIRLLKLIRLGLVLALSLLGYGFADTLKYGIGSWYVPHGQPAQMWSSVNFDPKLTDPFFESNKWSYPYWIIKHPDGHFEDTHSLKKTEKEPPRVKHTAECFSTSFGVMHLVSLSDAKLVDSNNIDLLIHKMSPSFRDALRVRIRNGMFMCQYWIIGHTRAFTWTTTRQRLTLDKKAFKKGDVIKGRIDFECVQMLTNPKDIKKWRRDPTKSIKVYGVFKTIVK